jgi:hypothetical protein
MFELSPVSAPRPDRPTGERDGPSGRHGYFMERAAAQAEEYGTAWNGAAYLTVHCVLTFGLRPSDDGVGKA